MHDGPHNNGNRDGHAGICDERTEQPASRTNARYSSFSDAYIWNRSAKAVHVTTIRQSLALLFGENLESGEASCTGIRE